MYIADFDPSSVLPMFVAFRGDSEGDGSVHLESEGVMTPPSLVPSARLSTTNPQTSLFIDLNYQYVWPYKQQYDFENLKKLFPKSRFNNRRLIKQSHISSLNTSMSIKEPFKLETAG